VTSYYDTTIVPLVAIFKKQVRHQLRYPGEFLIAIIIPYFLTTLLVVMGSFLGTSNVSANFAQRTGSTLPPFLYQIIGAGVWMVSWVIVETVGSSLRNEQINGTLEQNFLAPINRFVLLVGTALAQVIISMVLFVSVIAASVLVILPQDGFRILISFLVLLVGLIPMFGVGFVLAAFIVRFKEPYAFTQVVNLLFGVLGGTFYNIAILPVWAQYVSRALPLTHVISDTRLILEPTQAIVSTGGSILILLAMAFVYPVLGYTLFKGYEKQAKISGNLSKY
jgi:ABC-2 type transport system permease protein